MGFVDYIFESNKFTLNRALNCDKIYYSRLKEWSTTNAFRNFSIKYVLEGSINYKINNKYFTVNAGHFLLASQQPFAQAYFESKETTSSICIDVSPATINEAFTVLTRKKEHDIDNYAAGYFEAPKFCDHLNNVKTSQLQPHLKMLVNSLQHDETDLQEEFFLSLAENIILQEAPNALRIEQVHAKKSCTRKEIFERVIMGKEFMDDAFSSNPPVARIANECNLSPYLFFRSFRQVFKISPYQYLLNKRLELAGELITRGLSVSEAANAVTFTDLATFSKAFKKKIGISPGQLRKHNRSID